MKYLITGGFGFLGSNVAARLINDGNKVVIFDNLTRTGSRKNRAWLESIGDFSFCFGDIRNPENIERIVVEQLPDIVFHFAGQVAMTTSIDDPRLDFETNALGTFNLLNAIRIHSPTTSVIYSSTNKVYGDLEQYTYKENETRYVCLDRPNGFDESTPLDFHSPYGTSKGSADQYMLDFHRIYGIKTAVFRHSSMYGGRQFATEDQGWIGWFVRKALERRNNPKSEPFTISGNGKQVRDLLYADDMVELYVKASRNMNILAGMAFNIGGGMENSFSILELLSLLESELGVVLEYTRLPVRASDQRVFVADTRKCSKLLGWDPKIDKYAGVRNMISWVSDMVQM